MKVLNLALLLGVIFAVDTNTTTTTTPTNEDGQTSGESPLSPAPLT